MNVPSNLKYTKEHEWVRVEGDNAFVGITDFAQGELGEIVFVEVSKQFLTCFCLLAAKFWSSTKNWKMLPNWSTVTRMAKAGW